MVVILSVVINYFTDDSCFILNIKSDMSKREDQEILQVTANVLLKVVEFSDEIRSQVLVDDFSEESDGFVFALQAQLQILAIIFIDFAVFVWSVQKR